MKTTKRLLALVLALCMVLSVMPTVAFAADTTVIGEGTQTYADNSAAWTGTTYKFTPAENGTVTVDFTAADPGYSLMVAANDELLVSEYGAGAGTQTFQVTANTEYTITVGSAQYYENLSFGEAKAGTITYTITADVAAVSGGESGGDGEEEVPETNLTLNDGDNAIVLAANDQDGETWTYTPSQSGNLTITVGSLKYDWMGEGEYTEISDADLAFGFGRMYVLNVNGTSYYEPTATVEVTANEPVTVQLISNNGYATEANMNLMVEEDASTKVDVVLAAGDLDGETYTYTAVEDGNLLISVGSMKYDWMGEGEMTEIPDSELSMGFGRMYVMTVNGTAYYQPTATVAVEKDDVVTIQLVSANGYATEAVMTLTMEEPVEATAIALGDTETELASGNTNGNLFSYTAEQDGTLNIAVTALAVANAETGGWDDLTANIPMMFGMGNFSLAINGVEQTSSSTGSIEVAANDEVLIKLYSQYGYAAQATLNLAYEGGSNPDEGGDEGDSTLTPDENGVLAEATNAEVNSGEGYNESVELSYTATEDGIITLTMGEATPGWGYQIASPEEAASWMKTGTAETTVNVNLYEGETFTVYLYAYDKDAWSVANGNITYKLSFQAADLPDKVVEKEEYIVSDVVLAVGENGPLTLDEGAVTTIYEFSAEKAGIYTVTGPEGAIVGNWGGFGNLTNPESTTNSVEWECIAAGQSLYVGVSGVEGEFNLNVELIKETEQTVIEWVNYENQCAIEENFELELADEQKAAFVDITEEHDAVAAEDGYFHLDSADGPILYVDLMNPMWSIYDIYYGSMPAITLRGYLKDGEGEIVKRYDFLTAMNEYAEAMDAEGYYPLNDDLITFLNCFGNAQGWWMEGMSPIAAVADGTANENTNWILAMCVTVEDPTELGAGLFPVSGDLTAGETDYYKVYKMADTIITIEGDVTVTVDGKEYESENGVTTVYVDAPSPVVPVSLAVTNNGDEDVEYTMSLSWPVGSQNNPAELKLGENTVEIEMGDDDGYWYTWTATEDGFLKITMETEKNWSYSINNVTSYASTDTHTSGDEEICASDFIAVKAGDEVRVMVTTYDAKNPFSTPKGSITITAAVECPTEQYEDVNHEAWYHEDLNWMVVKRYMKGTGDTTMEPDAQLTRAQLVQMLYNIAGKPSVEGLTENFDDVNEDHWFYNAIVWACNLETPIVNGTSATTFEPDSNITREQVAAIMYRYAGAPEVEGDLTAFADAERVNDYAVDALIWATQNGIINGIAKGDVTNLAPRPVNENDKNDTEGLATRAQAAVILSRYLQK